MLYLTLTEKSKALQVSSGLVTSYDTQSGNEVNLFWDTHTCLLTYLPQTDKFEMQINAN